MRKSQREMKAKGADGRGKQQNEEVRRE